MWKFEPMICIISATNRPGSYTSLVATRIQTLIQERTQDTIHLISLDQLPMGQILDQMYQDPPVHPVLMQILEDNLIPSGKFWFVAPEYNGSYPGVLKVFLDACSLHDRKLIFHRKKACLTGVASGRAGNLRGLEHLTGVMHYMGVIVMPNMQPISSIHHQHNMDAGFNEQTEGSLIAQVDEFLSF